MVKVSGIGPKAVQSGMQRLNPKLKEVLGQNPYLGVATLIDKSGHSKIVPGTPRVMILSDLDGTWVGKDKEALAKLNEEMRRTCEDYTNSGLKVFWGYITARPPSRTLKSGAVMPPHQTVCYNGGKIFRGLPNSIKGLDVQDWARLNSAEGFESEKIFSMAEDVIKTPKYENLKAQTVGSVVNNLEADACPSVATLCIENESVKLVADETNEIFTEAKFKVPNQVKEFLSDLEEKIKDKKIPYNITGPYLFSGKPYVMFDVAAPKANKGDAVNFLTQKFDKRNVIVIGDGGNDITMMDDDGRNIIAVGKDHILRERVQGLKNDSVIIRPEDEACSTGVLQGIKQHLFNISERLKKEGALDKNFSVSKSSSYPWEHKAEKLSSEEAWRQYYA